MRRSTLQLSRTHLPDLVTSGNVASVFTSSPVIQITTLRSFVMRTVEPSVYLIEERRLARNNFEHDADGFLRIYTDIVQLL